MDHDLINLIVGLVIAGFAAAAKKSNEKKKADNGGATSAQPNLQQTEADRRYREVQEEVRRRIVQRNQNIPGQPATVTRNPVQDYKPSKQTTTPLKPLPTAWSKKAAPPPTLPASTMTMDAIPVMANAPIAPAMPSYPSEAAAYALPKDTGDNAASSSSSPGGSSALRAILASPNAARQAYLLREIFAQPLGLRPLASGGHEDWN